MIYVHSIVRLFPRCPKGSHGFPGRYRVFTNPRGSSPVFYHNIILPSRVVFLLEVYVLRRVPSPFRGPSPKVEIDEQPYYPPPPHYRRIFRTRRPWVRISKTKLTGPLRLEIVSSSQRKPSTLHLTLLDSFVLSLVPESFPRHLT